MQAIAFDPAKFFPGEDPGDDRSIVRIAYTGDDWAWPVYAIAIAEGCLAGEARSDACRTRLRARMVRAPALPGAHRPRRRGAVLVSQLVQRRALTDAAIRPALDRLGIEWLEADMDRCPGARTALARSAALAWVPSAISQPGPRTDLIVISHADIVEVVFDQHARRSTYRGHRADGSPAAWAVSLAETLEPCWRPAPSTPPWRSAPTSTPRPD